MATSRHTASGRRRDGFRRNRETEPAKAVEAFARILDAGLKPPTWTGMMIPDRARHSRRLARPRHPAQILHGVGAATVDRGAESGSRWRDRGGDVQARGAVQLETLNRSASVERRAVRSAVRGQDCVVSVRLGARARTRANSAPPYESEQSEKAARESGAQRHAATIEGVREKTGDSAGRAQLARICEPLHARKLSGDRQGHGWIVKSASARANETGPAYIMGWPRKQHKPRLDFHGRTETYPRGG